MGKKRSSISDLTSSNSDTEYNYGVSRKPIKMREKTCHASKSSARSKDGGLSESRYSRQHKKHSIKDEHTSHRKKHKSNSKNELSGKKHESSKNSSSSYYHRERKHGNNDRELKCSRDVKSLSSSEKRYHYSPTRSEHDENKDDDGSWGTVDVVQKINKHKISERLVRSLGYTDTENPFGDSSLTTSFVWTKKRQEERDDLDPEERRKREERRRLENERELEKLKRRRSERELMMQLREKEQLKLQREREIMETANWQLNDSGFYLQQTKLRTVIRAKEDRMIPIDLLAMNVIIAYDDKLAQEMFELNININDRDPHALFEYLSVKELEQLHKDIQSWIYLDEQTDSPSRPYWEALLVVSEMELEIRNESQNPPSNYVYSAVNSNIVKEINSMLKDKTPDELDNLNEQIKKKLSGDVPVDAEYWEVAIKLLIVWKAKLKLINMHASIIQICRDKLKKYGEENANLHSSNKPVNKFDVSRIFKAKVDIIKPTKEILPASDTIVKSGLGADKNVEEHSDNHSEFSISTEYYDPKMSPELLQTIPFSDLNVEIINYIDFTETLSNARMAAKQAFLDSVDPELHADYGAPSELTLEQNFFNEAAENMNMVDDTPPDMQHEPELVDVPFSSIEHRTDNISSLEYNNNNNLSKSSRYRSYYGKYKPRKPRYLNRVHTGYEWNKYNQTHYDSDNPPPKVIQGYKFNIFYPDLIDKTISPTYVRESDPDSPDTCIIRFKAGPPYEDIAFRIVNREWEYSHKKGYRCSFDRGILQLWFHFKRYYYRR